MFMGHIIFMKPILWLNGDRLCMINCKLLIKIKPGAFSNFPKKNILLASDGYIRPSLTLIDLLTNTRHVL
jgi:hypothetical protein